eukprot:Gb_03507 [translate_table: standard]
MRSRLLSNGLKWLASRRAQSLVHSNPGFGSSVRTDYFRQIPVVFERNLYMSGGESRTGVSLFSKAFSSETLVADKVNDEDEPDAQSQAPNSGNDNLQKRLFRLVFPKRSAVPVLQKWVNEGRELKKWELDRILRNLRKYHRYKHALEISEWMEDRKEFELSAGDYAVRLDLIAKVRGMASAEKYFTDLPVDAKDEHTYSALLHSYVREKLTEKAVALMEKMQELGFATHALPYNEIMALYMTIGQVEKVPLVIKEMKKNDVPRDAYSYNLWMSACAAVSDIEGVEMVLDEVKCDSRDIADWTTYSTLANIYIKAGLVEKAESALKEFEKKLTQRDRIAYDYLMTLYASLGNKEELLKTWESLKTAFEKATYTNYICILSSLAKLGDIEKAENIFEEWESSCARYDCRVSNILLAAYVRKGLLEKAEIFYGHVLEKGGDPNYKTWEILTEGYLESKQMDKAVVAMKKALLRVKSGVWQPKSAIVTSILKYFEEHGNVEGAEEYLEILRSVKCVTTEIYNSLLCAYVKAGKAVPNILVRMKRDNVSPDEETERLLEELSKLGNASSNSSE